MKPLFVFVLALGMVGCGKPKSEPVVIPAKFQCPFEECAVAEAIGLHQGKIVAYYQNGWRDATTGILIMTSSTITCSPDGREYYVSTGPIQGLFRDCKVAEPKP